MFVALELPDSIRKKLVDIQKRIDCGDADIRWSAPETMHLTLKFLGDVEAASVERVVEACGKAAASVGCAGWKVVLPYFNFFPIDRPKVVAAAVSASPELLELQAAVDKHLAGIGFPPEARGFNPHVTVGRIKTRGRGKSLKLRGLSLSITRASGRAASWWRAEIGRFPAREIVVFRSDLAPDGAIHTPVGRVPLRSS
jgi:2'-5' RNA ligase